MVTTLTQLHMLYCPKVHSCRVSNFIKINRAGVNTPFWLNLCNDAGTVEKQAEPKQI